jgi:hypothetical protein
MEEALANAFATCRTGGSVFMDGSHNPTMTERRNAADFVKWHVAPITAERDDLQALVNDIAPFVLLAVCPPDLLARLDAAAKEDQ